MDVLETVEYIQFTDQILDLVFSPSTFPTIDGLQYIASHEDLIQAFGANAVAGLQHYAAAGQAEGRTLDTFDEVQYLANYADLQAAFGDDTEAATRHFITNGLFEGRTDRPAGAAEVADFLL